MKAFNLKSIPFLILLSLMFMDFQCSECENETYETAEYNISLSTDQDVFTIGDTLLMGSSISSEIPLVSNGSIHDNSNQSISYGFSIFKAKSDRIDMLNGVKDFEFANIKGNAHNFSESSYQIGIDNLCSESLCEFEVGIIPQKAGYYGLLLQPTNIYNTDECVYIDFRPKGIESIDDNNFSVFNEINLDRIRVGGYHFDNPESEDALYFFKVIE